ncbi:hypothetical protein SUGI_1183180 [Cryptomeria japonica]|nr:hypothetical protein SUGI_1183180 [Cryptomeria japonica]
MSKEYILFDKNAYSGRIVLFHQDVLWNSGNVDDKKLFEKEADGKKVLGVNALENTILSRVFSKPLGEEFCWGSSDESDNDGIEDCEEIDALLGLDDRISSTEDFQCRAKVRESLKRLRDEISGGGEWVNGDAVQVIEEAIRSTYPGLSLESDSL